MSMMAYGITHCIRCLEPYTNGFECACTRKEKQEREEKLSMLLNMSKDEIETLIGIAKREVREFKKLKIKLQIEKLNKKLEGE